MLTPPTSGQPAELLPGIVRLTAPNPSIMTGPGTNTYLVGWRELVAIDPGPEHAGHLSSVAAVADGRLRAILVTHTHPDHAPGAAALARLTGARVLGFDARDGFEPDGLVGEGSHIEAGDLVLRALHTPGHASNHLCYLAATEGREGCPSNVLFSGDHIMGGSTVVIAPPDGDMADYLASLDRLLEMEPKITVIAPGHGPMLPRASEVISGYLSHRLAREAAIVGALGDLGSGVIPEIVAVVYSAVPEALHPIARLSVWAHLRKLVDEKRAVCDDPDDIAAVWVAVRG